MSTSDAFDDEDALGVRVARVAGPILIIVVVGLAVWWFANQETGVHRANDVVSLLVPVQAPPPPPPPKIKPVEPTKPVEHEIVQQQRQAAPPKPAAVNNPVTENAPAEAGTDSFNIGAGNGGGQNGSGPVSAFDRGAFNAYLAQTVQRAIKADPELGAKYFHAVVAIWLSPAGKIIRVAIRTSSGSDTYDQRIVHVLTQMPALDPPPKAVLDTLPIQLAIDLRNSL